MRAQLLAAALLSISVTPGFADEPAPSSGPISAITSLKSMILPTGTEESKAECAAQCGDVCCNRPRLYGSVEYLLYWFENQRVPPLVVDRTDWFAVPQSRRRAGRNRALRRSKSRFRRDRCDACHDRLLARLAAEPRSRSQRVSDRTTGEALRCRFTTEQRRIPSYSGRTDGTLAIVSALAFQDCFVAEWSPLNTRGSGARKQTAF